MFYQSSLNFCLKQGCFFPVLQRCIYDRELHYLQPPASLLPAGRWAQRLNDEPVKDLNLVFFTEFGLFYQFHFEMRANVQKT